MSGNYALAEDLTAETFDALVFSVDEDVRYDQIGAKPRCSVAVRVRIHRADHELRTLQQIKRRLAGPRWLLLLAMIFTMQAFGRIVSDTSFDVSPRKFIATAAVAAIFWAAFLVRLFYGRREVLVRIRR